VLQEYGRNMLQVRQESLANEFQHAASVERLRIVTRVMYASSG
jgi:hypothetical protein